jgi:hypothetical protein
MAGDLIGRLIVKDERAGEFSVLFAEIPDDFPGLAEGWRCRREAEGNTCKTLDHDQF